MSLVDFIRSAVQVSAGAKDARAATKGFANQLRSRLLKEGRDLREADTQRRMLAILIKFERAWSLEYLAESIAKKDEEIEALAAQAAVAQKAKDRMEQLVLKEHALRQAERLKELGAPESLEALMDGRRVVSEEDAAARVEAARKEEREKKSASESKAYSEGMAEGMALGRLQAEAELAKARPAAEVKMLATKALAPSTPVAEIVARAVPEPEAEVEVAAEKIVVSEPPVVRSMGQVVRPDRVSPPPNLSVAAATINAAVRGPVDEQGLLREVETLNKKLLPVEVKAWPVLPAPPASPDVVSALDSGALKQVPCDDTPRTATAERAAAARKAAFYETAEVMGQGLKAAGEAATREDWNGYFERVVCAEFRGLKYGF